MNHYMVLPCTQYVERNYITILFQYHSVPGMVPFELRECNDTQTLYYHLQYRTTLKMVLDHHPIDTVQLKNMILSMIQLFEIVDEYLLDINQIIWKAECIFIDVDTGKLQFCYTPDENEEQGTIQHFLMELIQYFDKKEENLFLLLKLYHLVTEEDFNVEDIRKYRREYLDNLQNEDCLQFVLDNGYIENNAVIQDEEPMEGRTDSLSIWISVVKILFVIAIVVNFILIGLLLLNQLPYDAIQYLLISMCVLIGITVALLLLTREESPEQMMEEYTNRQQLFTTYENEEYERQETNTSWEYRERKEDKPVNNPIYEETTVLGQIDDEKEIVVETREEVFVLEAIIKDRYPSISIQEESVVIGTLDNMCNYHLKERGVSRMHAKLMKKTEGLYLIDLNSTNGTYVNGEMLQGGEEYLLEEGDLVAFATCEFYFKKEYG